VNRIKRAPAQAEKRVNLPEPAKRDFDPLRLCGSGIRSLSLGEGTELAPQANIGI